MRKKAAVIGAGNGGQAIAGHLGLSGWEVWLHDIDAEKISRLEKKGKIDLGGDESGTATHIHATTKFEEAVKDAALIMVTTAATSHEDVATGIAPFLKDNQMIILNPGYFLGAWAFSRALRRGGCKKEILLADTECLIYACRSEVPGEVYISGIKNRLFVAAFPGYKLKLFFDSIKQIYPQCEPAKNILETAFGNVNLVLHAPIALLNAGSIDSQREFFFYREGGTPSIMRLEEALDGERLAVASRFGIRARSIKELLTDYYGITGHTLHEFVTKNPAYRPIKAPQSLQTRLITEDIPMGLVPVASAADQFGVNAALHHTLVNLASSLLEVDFWKQGRTMQNLGLSAMSADEILRVLNEGEPC
jgi:opine dehydrogenase